MHINQISEHLLIVFLSFNILLIGRKSNAAVPQYLRPALWAGLLNDTL